MESTGSSRFEKAPHLSWSLITFSVGGAFMRRELLAVRWRDYELGSMMGFNKLLL